MITNKWGRIVGLLCIVLIGVLVACGDDDKPAENNNGGNNTLTDAGDTDKDTSQNVNADYKSEYQLRFTSFAFNGDSPGKSLNGVLAQNFDQEKKFPVIILVEMQDLDVAKQSVSVRGGSGLKTDVSGTYKWDPDGDVDELTTGKIEANGKLDATLPKLDFVASFEDQNGEPLKTIIPIKGLSLKGHLSAKEDGSEPTIDDGILEGYVTLEDGDATVVVIPLGTSVSELPLTNVFQKKNLNYSVNNDGVMDAWKLTASFTAVETKIVD